MEAIAGGEVTAIAICEGWRDFSLYSAPHYCTVFMLCDYLGMPNAEIGAPSQALCIPSPTVPRRHGTPKFLGLAETLPTSLPLGGLALTYQERWTSKAEATSSTNFWAPQARHGRKREQVRV